MNASCLMLPRRPAAQTFRDLLVWQKAHEFVLGVYQLTTAFPRQGDLWAFFADAPGGRIDRGQHR